MKVETGWYDKDHYYVVKPLHNGHRQSLIMGAQNGEGGRWYILAGIFPSCATYNSMNRSKVWDTPTSTNKNPSMKVVSLALEALAEIEILISRDAEIPKQAMNFYNKYMRRK